MTIPKYFGSSTRKPPASRTLPGAETRVEVDMVDGWGWLNFTGGMQSVQYRVGVESQQSASLYGWVAGLCFEKSSRMSRMVSAYATKGQSKND